jgi:hypothetical protein
MARANMMHLDSWWLAHCHNCPENGQSQYAGLGWLVEEAFPHVG